MATKKNTNTNAQQNTNETANIFDGVPDYTPEQSPVFDMYGDVAHVVAQPEQAAPATAPAPAAGPIFMDLTNPDEEFSPIPAGSLVVAQVKGAEFKISSKGNLMIAVRYSVIEPHGAAPANAADWKNRTIRDNLMFMPPNPATGSKGTIWRVKRTFTALGMPWTGRPFATEADYHEWITAQAEEMIGRLSILELGIDESSGTNPETGEAYPPRNTVVYQKAYTAPALPRNVPIRANAANTPAFDPEDLPF